MSTYLYTVEGPGRFPFDMLRYDAAWPASQRDATQLELPAMRADRNKVREVELLSHRDPTTQRWASFGWHVKDVRKSSRPG